MNRKMIANTIGTMMLIEAAMLLLPMTVSLIYNEKDYIYFVITAVFAAAVGGLIKLITRKVNFVIFAKDGFVTVALSWIVLSVIGAVPFRLSGAIPHYIDALFETISGFTTTGASILTDVEALTHGMLFWRSFTHFVGGMGVLVFIMAVLPNASERSIHILRAEVPGPSFGKLTPRLKDTAKILYLLYIALTFIETVALCIAGMPLFDSIVHAFGTAGTGGFGIKAASIGAYDPACQWIIAIFMFLFGVNFNMYYLILLGKFRAILKSTELKFYICLVALATAGITANVFSLYKNIGDCLRLSFFQVTSIISTTGYATANFDTWPALSKGIIFVLMFFGGCAGSTAGGLKLARLLLLLKQTKRQLHKLVHPRAVTSIRMEGKVVDEGTLDGVSNYFSLYIAIIAVVFLLISFENFGLETNLTAAISCFNNVGPGFGMISPIGSYADYSYFSKIVLSLAMLLGRLEIYPLIVLLSPSVRVKSR